MSEALQHQLMGYNMNPAMSFQHPPMNKILHSRIIKENSLSTNRVIGGDKSSTGLRNGRNIAIAHFIKTRVEAGFKRNK